MKLHQQKLVDLSVSVESIAIQMMHFVKNTLDFKLRNFKHCQAGNISNDFSGSEDLNV